MDRLWQVLLRVADGEEGEPLSCEDCFIVLDCLSDLLADGYGVDELMPLAQRYLQRCPSCDGEFREDVAELLLAERREGGSHGPSPLAEKPPERRPGRYPAKPAQPNRRARWS